MRRIGAILVAVLAVGGSIGGAAQARPMQASSTMSCRMAMMRKVPRMMRHMEMPGLGSCVAFRPAFGGSGFTAAASSAVVGHPASAALGRMGKSFWESARLGGRVGLPQTFTITLDGPRTVTGLQYLPRRGVGEIGRFVVSVSGDGRHFGPAVALGRWQDNAINKQVEWLPRVVRAVRVRVLSASPVGAAHVGADRFVLTGVRASSSAGGGGSGSGGGADAGKDRAQDGVAAASTNASVVGSWGPTIGFPIDPVAAALVPGDRLVVWSANAAESFDDTNAEPYTMTAVYNLATGAISQSTVTDTGHNMFCPGVSILPNGNLLVSGGIGNQQTSIYNVSTGAWSAGPMMNIGRGYQGQTTLSDGQAFTLGGSWVWGNTPRGGKLGEVYSGNGAWRELIGVPANPIYTNDAAGVYRADNHGWFIASSGGSVFQAGPSAQMHWITTTGAGSITDAGARGTAGDEMNGDAVLFDVNKILASGGAPDYENSNAVTSSNVIDISGGPGSTPTVTATAPLNFARGFSNSVVLPTGNVFTVGGESYPITFDDATSVLSPELFNPATNNWTVMATGPTPRNYHSVAVLLPDGTVFSGGGGLCGSTCKVNHPDGQIWSPPYLFNADGSLATRPKIVSAPATATTGQTITVTTDSPVSSFDLMRYGEATHTVDNDQRRIPLSINSQSGDTYTMTIPADPGVALPGPYMLFAVNGAGTPSVAATVMVSTPAVGAPTTTYGQTVNAAGPELYWPLADASGSSASDLSGDRDTGNYSAGGVSYGAPSPVEGATGQGVALAGGQVIASQPQAAPTTYTEEVWFKTTSTTGGAIMGFGDSSTGANKNADRVVYMTATGHLDFGTYAGQTNVIQSPGAYNDGNWHFLAATQGADGMHLYVDGQPVAANTVTTNQAYLAYFQLGGAVKGWPNATTSAFTGTISDAAMYLSELTPSQITSTYTATPPATPGTSTSTSTSTNKGKGTGTGTSSGPSSAKIKRTLAAAIAIPKLRARLGRILKAGGVSMKVKVPSAGTLVVRWYVKAGHKKRMLIASGKLHAKEPGRKTLKIRLTRAGRKRLKKAKTIKVLIRATFTPAHHKAMTEQRTVRLKR
jgi:galactose oxidase